MLSIIIPARNQHELLGNTLMGLTVQVSLNPAIDIEVIVVDNGSVPPLEDVLASRGGYNFDLSFIRRPLGERLFRVASARNIGIGAARGDAIIFLDSDCVPGPSFLSDHWACLSAATSPTLTLSHRVFVDGSSVNVQDIRERGCLLDHLALVHSASNYGMQRDRRLEELKHFEDHPMPFNCCHGCNLGVRRLDLPCGEAFDSEFDGQWGYEDIEFGYRMWKAGVALIHLPGAFVYHQEGDGLSAARRRHDRQRSYELACAKIPLFRQFREGQARSYYNLAEPNWRGSHEVRPGGSHHLEQGRHHVGRRVRV